LISAAIAFFGATVPGRGEVVDDGSGRLVGSGLCSAVA
jgi:hypothetical protein